MTSSELEKFTADLDFVLDPFQIQGCEALEAGRGVLVCAPTGAGKTVVGEFAVHLALAGGTKCFYTTPIKALSNQKHAELTARYGAHNVGLLTGDTSINSHAPVVVMTTEVLRNMLYADSATLDGLSHVVMDEVHYLADRFRGAVWEEVILHLPQDVRLVSLSATVSNAEEFGAWITEVRGHTTVIVDEHRPVPLWQHMLVGRKLFDLFDTKALAKGDGGAKNLVLDADLVRYVKQRESLDRSHDPGIVSRTGRRAGRGRPQITRRPIPRPDVIALLDGEGLLPAITFVFSRSGCEQALTQCLRSPVVLTTAEQADEIGRIVDKHVAEFSPADLDLLGYEEWRAALLRGFAAHHAGMLPAFRHAVEELFVKGLVRAVFATETLALGINMPARTVVLERLVKYNGESHVELTPGEYTQLTGRAGRRGIDIEGHAVVLWQSGVRPQEVAGLAGARTFPLISSFTPGYNMSINLLDRLGRDGAERLLEASFAQFQADRSVVGLAKRVERGEKELAALRTELTEAAGGADYLEYVRLREAVRARERSLRREHLADRRDGAATALAELRRGDVIAVTVADAGAWPWSWNPRATAATPSPSWSPRAVGRAGSAPPTSSGRSRCSARCGSRRTPTTARDAASATWRPPSATAPSRPRGSRRRRTVRPRPTRSSPTCAPGCARTRRTPGSAHPSWTARPSGTRDWSARSRPRRRRFARRRRRSPSRSSGSSRCSATAGTSTPSTAPPNSRSPGTVWPVCTANPICWCASASRTACSMASIPPDWPPSSRRWSSNRAANAVAPCSPGRRCRARSGPRSATSPTAGPTSWQPRPPTASSRAGSRTSGSWPRSISGRAAERWPRSCWPPASADAHYRPGTSSGGVAR